MFNINYEFKNLDYIGSFNVVFRKDENRISLLIQHTRSKVCLVIRTNFDLSFLTNLHIL